MREIAIFRLLKRETRILRLCNAPSLHNLHPFPYPILPTQPASPTHYPPIPLSSYPPILFLPLSPSPPRPFNTPTISHPNTPTSPHAPLFLPSIFHLHCYRNQWSRTAQHVTRALNTNVFEHNRHRWYYRKPKPDLLLLSSSPALFFGFLHSYLPSYL